MSLMSKTIALLITVVALLPAIAERQPFDRYQSIIDRQMFGALPPGFDPTKSPAEVSKTTAASAKELTKEQEKVKSSIHFSVINVTPEGDTAIGFTDNSDPKTPVHYYLKVGEERNGWMVKEADPETATMTIAKDGIEVSLSIGGDSAKDAGATANGAMAAGGAPSRGRALLAGSGRGLLGGGGSLRARRLQRQQVAAEEKAKADAAAAEMAAERAAKAEEEKAQREAERAEQRQQLLAIQEELKRVREAKAAEKNDAENTNEEAQ